MTDVQYKSISFASSIFQQEISSLPLNFVEGHMSVLNQLLIAHGNTIDNERAKFDILLNFTNTITGPLDDERLRFLKVTELVNTIH